MNASDTGGHQQKRASVVVLVLFALAAPIVAFGARGALKSTSNDPRQWLPKDFPETDTYDWFERSFGTDEIAVVSWPQCTLDNVKVSEVADAIAATPYFDKASSGISAIEELTSPPLDLSKQSAIRRLSGVLVGSGAEGGKRITCIAASTSSEGKDDRVAAVKAIESITSEVAEVPLAELRLAGPTVDAAAIDAESRKLLFQLAGFSAIVSFVIATLRMGSISMALIVLMIAGFSTGLSLAILYFSGSKMNLLMTMLPPLVYVLCISSAVHLANYYRDACASMPRGEALRAAIGHGRMPCFLAAVTTAIGLVSLVMSKIEPIQSFGIFSSVGVLASVAVLFIGLPAAIRVFDPDPKAGKDPGGTPTMLDAASSTTHGRSLVGGIARHHALFATVCMCVMVFFAVKLPSIRSTVKLQDRFLDESDAIQDYQWLEKHIGPMVPLEIVLRFSADDQRSPLQQLLVVSQVQRRIQQLDEPVSAFSAVNMAPKIPSGRSVRDVVQRKLINSEKTTNSFRSRRFLNETDDETQWRISIRANAIGDLDYGLFAQEIEQSVAPVLEEADVSGTFTGVIPLIYKAQRQLLQDLFRSFLSAFVVIAFVLVFVLRSLAAALMAMVPNLFPAVVVFGGIQWAGIPVQIGSVMTASAALGIAVDDTVHFLTWFRRGLDNGLSRRDSIVDAFGRCAGAMVHTTMICAGGLLVFAVSTFVPILHFAWLMVLLLLSALIGDLILLPAILSGPLGKVFDRSERDESSVP